MCITKQKQTHKYTKQTSGYQWGKDRGSGLRNTNYYIENR